MKKTELKNRLDAAKNRIAELETARLQAETLFAVTQVLGKTLSLEETIEAILEELQRVVPYDSCSVQVIHGDRLVIVGERGLDDLGGLIGVGFDLDDETNPGIQVVRSKQPTVLGDVSGHSHFAAQLHGGGRIRGWICVPMIHSGRVIGVISIDKFEPDFYNEALAEVATAFAAEAAIAIENARLLETERAAREQSETLRAAAQSLGSTLGIPEVFDLILSELRKVVPYESASVQQLHGDDFVIVGGHGFPNLDELLGHRFSWKDPGDPAHELVQRREPIFVPDVAERFESYEDAHGESRVKSFMAVPLLIGERLIGMLTLDSFETDFYTAEHADTAGAFAALAATAIEKARHLSELEHARQHAETLLATTQVLGKTLSLEDTIEAILEELQRVVPYDTCSVQVIQGNRLVIAGGRGFDDLDALLGQGFDLERREQPQRPGRAVQEAAGLRRRGAEPAFRRRLPRQRAHPRLDLRADDRRRSRPRRPQHRQVRARLLHRGARGARDGVRSTGRDRDRERTAARDRAGRSRAGRDAPCGGGVAGKCVRRVRDLRPDPGRDAQGGAVHGRQRPAARRRRVRDRRRARLPEPRGRCSASATTVTGPEDPACEMVRSAEPIIVADVAERFANFQDPFGPGSIKSWMAVPLIADDRLIGMLTFDSFEADFYTREHANTAKAFARLRRDGGREGAVRHRAGAGAGGGGGGDAGEERVPGDDEPRDPHADERGDRHDRSAARHAI